MTAVSLRDKSLALRYVAGGNALARALARAVDPVSLGDQLGLALDEWQESYLGARVKRILVNCHRQSGKSTIAAIRAVRRAVVRPRSLILILSPAQRQSGEVLAKCVNVYHDLGRPVVAEAENALSLILENGSRIISLPGSAATVRGYSAVDAIIVDEASLVKDEVLPAISPMLAVSGGALEALSTPSGKRGWWYEAWSQGGDGWLRLLATADQCLRISKEFLHEERLRLGQRLFQQEYMCEFIEVKEQAFPERYVNAAFDRTLEPITFGDMPEA